MTSPQERLVSALAAHSMGAPFVFLPDEYRKGSATREPADVAWACNNTLILMNMTSGGRSFAQKAQHNFKGFMGRMRAWKSGQTLCGRNRFLTFAIPYGVYRHVILVSVLDGKDAQLEWNKGVEHECGAGGFAITGCFTIPEDVLRSFARLGGSARDLVSLLEHVRTRDNAMSADDAMQLVRETHTDALNASFVGPLGPKLRGHRQFNAIASTLLGLRIRSDTTLLTHPIENTPAGGGLISIINDLAWADAIVLAAVAQASVDAVRSGTLDGQRITGIARPVAAAPYQFMVGAIQLAEPGFAVGVANGIEASRQDPYPKQGLLLALADPWPITGVFLSHPRSGPSATEMTLDRWTR